MSHVAMIRRVAPALMLDEWLRLAGSDARFVRPEPREIDNPFKPGRRAVVTPHVSHFTVVVDRRVLGSIVASDDFADDGELDVFGNENEPILRAVANEVARSLRAEIVWFEDP